SRVEAAWSGAPAVEFKRDGQTLTIIIPPPPATLRIIAWGMALFICAVISAIIASLIVMHGSDPFSLGFFALTILPVVSTARRLIHAARNGKKPAVIRVTLDDLHIRPAGAVRMFDHQFRRDQIAGIT